MENASKALLIAGGMLITIIIVGVLVMAWNNMRELPKTQEQIREAEELSAFNKKYESYAKNGTRGSDLVTVVNMANSNNKKYEDHADMQITVKFKITKDLEQIVRKYVYRNNRWEQDGSPTYESVDTDYDNTSDITRNRL